jgi:radical SAM superfamily enzyme YgiQ (UPF0313 family)
MAHVLLINPWIYDFTAYDLWSKPLGLLYIASYLRETGYSVSFIDCLDKYEPGVKTRVKQFGVGHYRREEVAKPEILKHIPRRYARYGISEEYFLEQIKNSPRPDAVLVTSVMTYWYLGPKRVVELVRDYLPGVPVILGGVYATLLPGHAQKVIQPDHIITGPGELKVARLLAELTGATFDESSVPQSLDDYPYPAFDLQKNHDYLVVMTARGCPYDCSFCAQKQIAMSFTQRDPDKVVEEIVRHQRKYRVNDFAFYDDALFIRRDHHIKPILRKIIETKKSLRLHSPNGLFARYIDAELAQLMYDSGFKTIRISFETSNEGRRKDMYNKISNEAMVQAVENLVNAGYRPSDLEAYVIMGLPNQSLEEVIASILFINNLGVQVRLASFSPIPGTLDFDRAVEEGLIPADIDPLLTNKSIFPLKKSSADYETYRKLRTFALILNEGAQRDLRPFADAQISAALLNVTRELS